MLHKWGGRGEGGLNSEYCNGTRINLQRTCDPKFLLYGLHMSCAILCPQVNLHSATCAVLLHIGLGDVSCSIYRNIGMVV